MNEINENDTDLDELLNQHFAGRVVRKDRRRRKRDAKKTGRWLIGPKLDDLIACN